MPRRLTKSQRQLDRLMNAIRSSPESTKKEIALQFFGKKLERVETGRWYAKNLALERKKRLLDLIAKSKKLPNNQLPQNIRRIIDDLISSRSSVQGGFAATILVPLTGTFVQSSLKDLGLPEVGTTVSGVAVAIGGLGGLVAVDSFKDLRKGYTLLIDALRKSKDPKINALKQSGNYLIVTRQGDIAAVDYGRLKALLKLEMPLRRIKND